MPVRLLETVEVLTYMQNGKRLLYLLSLSGGSVLVEDALSGQESLMTVEELARRPWKRVYQKEN